MIFSPYNQRKGVRKRTEANAGQLKGQQSMSDGGVICADVFNSEPAAKRARLPSRRAIERESPPPPLIEMPLVYDQSAQKRSLQENEIGLLGSDGRAEHGLVPGRKAILGHAVAIWECLRLTCVKFTTHVVVWIETCQCARQKSGQSK